MSGNKSEVHEEKTRWSLKVNYDIQPTMIKYSDELLAEHFSKTSHSDFS